MRVYYAFRNIPCKNEQYYVNTNTSLVYKALKVNNNLLISCIIDLTRNFKSKHRPKLP